MKIFHHTSIARASPDNKVEFDETLNDYVWQGIWWHLITRDGDMNTEGGSRKYVSLHYTELPYPFIPDYIPHDNVGDRDILRWIHKTEGVHNIHRKQQDNLVGFLRKYNLLDQWKGNI